MHEIFFWFSKQFCEQQRYDDLKSDLYKYEQELSRYQDLKYWISRRVGPSPKRGWYVHNSNLCPKNLRECISDVPLSSAEHHYIPDLSLCNHELISCLDEQYKLVKAQYNQANSQLQQLHEEQVAKGYLVTADVCHISFRMSVEEHLIDEGFIEYDYKKNGSLIPDSTIVGLNQKILEICVDNNFLDTLIDLDVQSEPFLITFE